jgi:hypothetical protein
MLKLLPFRIKRGWGHVTNTHLISIIPMIKFDIKLVQCAYVGLSFRDMSKAVKHLYTAYLCDWVNCVGGG